jgi:hypothetical protein
LPAINGKTVAAAIVVESASEAVFEVDAVFGHRRAFKFPLFYSRRYSHLTTIQ